ncbi:LEKR1 protein, partial [Amia calva]|nr:LEKR1 protein [Amia calva]
MDRNETICKYCGVSYLIHHEFKLMEEKVKTMEAEMALYRGSVEREKRLQEDLQGMSTQLEQLKAVWEQQSESLKVLGLKLAEKQTQLETLTTDMSITERELGEAVIRCQTFRLKYQQQSSVLKKTLCLLQSSKKDLMTLRQVVSDFSGVWGGLSIQLLKRSKETDTGISTLEETVVRTQAETLQLHEQKASLEQALATAQVDSQQLAALSLSEQQLQRQNRQMQNEMLDLNNQNKTLQLDLRELISEREHLKQLLQAKSKEIEDHHHRQIQFEKDQKNIQTRLCKELRDKEEMWLAGQKQCKYLQEELTEWGRKEEEIIRRNSRTENEMATLRTALKQAGEEIAMLKKERDLTVLSHQSTIEQLQESLRTRMVDAESLRSQVDVELQKQRKELSLQLKETELNLRREANMELNIEREKFQELLQKYKKEHEELQEKVPSLIHCATKELKSEIMLLEEELGEARRSLKRQESSNDEEMEHLRKMVSTLDNQLQQSRTDSLRSEARQATQQRALQLKEVSQELEQLTQESSQLKAENALLQETVRMECEERYELTAALGLAREQLLQLKRLGGGLRLSQHSLSQNSLASTPPSARNQGQRDASSRGSGTKHDSVTSLASGVEIPLGLRQGSGGSCNSLPTIPLPKRGAASLSESRHRIAAALRRKERA